jgi:hypothetical protein
MTKYSLLRDALHYAAVYGVLLYSWIPVMNYFKGDIYMTAFVGAWIFIITDKVAHKIFFGESWKQ